MTMRNASTPVTDADGHERVRGVIDAVHATLEHGGREDDGDQLGEFRRLQAQSGHPNPPVRAVDLVEEEDGEQTQHGDAEQRPDHRGTLQVVIVNPHRHEHPDHAQRRQAELLQGAGRLRASTADALTTMTMLVQTRARAAQNSILSDLSVRAIRCHSCPLPFGGPSAETTFRVGPRPGTEPGRKRSTVISRTGPGHPPHRPERPVFPAAGSSPPRPI